MKSNTNRGHAPELLRLVLERHSNVHRLHAQHLVVALLVIEHRRREIVEYILVRERSVSLVSHCEVGLLSALHDEHDGNATPVSIRAK